LQNDAPPDPVQRFPHPPQLLLSEERLKQPCGQAVSGAMHVDVMGTQAPFVHVSPAGHAIPHLPQLAVVDKVTHEPPQLTVPEGQVTKHWPVAQAWPFGHVLSHAPQFVGLEPRSTHWPPQSVMPTKHGVTTAHVPPEHAAPAGQAFAHDPQSLALEVRLTHEPLQLVVPLGHCATHRPAAQACPVGQTFAHAPQFDGLRVRSTHAPPQWVAPFVQPPSGAPPDPSPLAASGPG
jgi:hypothetical protein